MKRLLRKKAEFIDAIEDRRKYVEIYKNPTGREFDAIKEYSDTVRAFLHPNGDIYAWRSDVLHDRMARLKPERASDFRAEALNNKLILYLTSNVKTLEQVVNLFNAVDFGKLNLKESTPVEFDLFYYSCVISDSIYLNDKNIGEVKKINLDQTSKDKLDYLYIFEKLVSENNYRKISEYAVTNDAGIYIHYDENDKNLHIVGPFINKSIINDPNNINLINNYKNDRWRIFVNNIDADPTISFDDRTGDFKIDFTNSNGFYGTIIQNNDNDTAKLNSLFDPNGEDVLDLFVFTNNDSYEIVDPIVLRNFYFEI